jgi:hypothetical protein
MMFILPREKLRRHAPCFFKNGGVKPLNLHDAHRLSALEKA